MERGLPGTRGCRFRRRSRGIGGEEVGAVARWVAGKEICRVCDRGLLYRCCRCGCRWGRCRGLGRRKKIGPRGCGRRKKIRRVCDRGLLYRCCRCGCRWGRCRGLGRRKKIGPRGCGRRKKIGRVRDRGLPCRGCRGRCRGRRGRWSRGSFRGGLWGRRSAPTEEVTAIPRGL